MTTILDALAKAGVAFVALKENIGSWSTRRTASSPTVAARRWLRRIVVRLPAYPDDRDGTGIIYEWLQRGRSSDSDNDGVARESGNNPNGYGDPADGAAGVPGRRGKPGVGGRLAGVLFLLAFTARVVRPPAAETAPSPDPAGAASVGR